MVQKVQNAGLLVSLFSFGFKYGPPADANLILDVRFLPNPYWEDHLRSLTGLDDSVSDYVLHSEGGKHLIQHLVPFIKLLFAEYQQAGKEQLRIGIGCTGGQHRSVAVVAFLHKQLCDAGVPGIEEHRDIGKE